MLTFCATKFQGMPAPRTFGMVPAVLETWVPPGMTAEDAALGWAERASDERGILIFDWEPFPDFRKPDTAESVKYFRDVTAVADLVHERFPWVPMGHHHLPHHEGRSRRSDYARPWAFCCPEVYVYPGQSIAAWKREARRRLEIARTYDRRIYPVVNPTYTVEPWGLVPDAVVVEMADYLAGERERGNVDAQVWWGGHWYDAEGNFRVYEFNATAAWVRLAREGA